MQKDLFRGRVVATFGPAFPIDDLRKEYEKDERRASRILTDKIQENLEAVTLNVEEHEELELVEVADRLYARAKSLLVTENEMGSGIVCPGCKCSLRVFAG